MGKHCKAQRDTVSILKKQTMVNYGKYIEEKKGK